MLLLFIICFLIFGLNGISILKIIHLRNRWALDVFAIACFVLANRIPLSLFLRLGFVLFRPFWNVCVLFALHFNDIENGISLLVLSDDFHRIFSKRV